MIASGYNGVTIHYKEKEVLALLWEDIVKTSYRKNIFTIKVQKALSLCKMGVVKSLKHIEKAC